MNWLGLGVSILWALGSAQLLVQGWGAYANAFIALVALARGRMKASRAAGAVIGALMVAAVCSLLLRGGFWWLVEVKGFGTTWQEQALYCTSLGPALGFLLPRLGRRIRTSWQTAMEGGAILDGLGRGHP